jgi:hypothetical protein
MVLQISDRWNPGYHLKNAETNLYLVLSPRLLTFPLVDIRFFSWLECTQEFNRDCLYRFLLIIIVSASVRERGTGCNTVTATGSTKILKLVAPGIFLPHEKSIANLGKNLFQNCVAKMRLLYIKISDVIDGRTSQSKTHACSNISLLQIFIINDQLDQNPLKVQTDMMM